MDKRKYILDLFSHVSMDSVLVITGEGILQRLYCPFLVVAVIDIPPFKKDDTAEVTAIKMTLELKEVYIISQKAYFIWYFKII